jgi:hypothetical protein
VRGCSRWSAIGGGGIGIGIAGPGFAPDVVVDATVRAFRREALGRYPSFRGAIPLEFILVRRRAWRAWDHSGMRFYGS